MHQKSQIPEKIKDEARNAMHSMCLVSCLEALPKSCIIVGPTMFDHGLIPACNSTYVHYKMFPALNVYSYSKMREGAEVMHNQEGHVVVTE